MEILKNSLSSKILLLISVLFLLLITLSTINAAETNINSTDNLGQTIENASNGDIINLEAGIYTNNVTNILVNKSLTIQGKNPQTTIINAQNLGRIFNITSTGTLTLINITLINGNASDGGAIYNNNGKVTINYCIFENNTASSSTNARGGAIYNIGSAGNLTINNSIFNNNNALIATANRQGGAIYNTNFMNINNSTFTKNTAASGAAIYNAKTSIINNSSFINNEASSHGGAIFNSQLNNILKISNSTFINNTAPTGGAIRSQNPGNTTVIGSSFINNTAGVGGAISTDNQANLNVSYSRFVNNTDNNNYTINARGTTTILDYNWWGSNINPNQQINGTNVNNYFIMNVTNLTSLNSNGTVTFKYTFKLNDTTISFDSSLLPYFTTDVYTNITNGVIKSFDARYEKIFNITVKQNNSILYSFILDNEVQTLEGNMTLPPEPPVPPIPPVPPVPPTPPVPPLPPNPTPEPNNNNNTKNINNNSIANAAMKETGMPVIAVILVLLSCIGLLARKQ
ncbi:adhesin-like protein [Methanobrevibacter arboriphilus JCM 13429 = DSM 1125]|uniref:Adhesin-like protein n=1 Tax=Methanobrevibacter arboriphilus JCM 13429 = DSM 1125 TaxID=1300164 RepID=A0A1V6N1C9_METAZ|nr:hypothetical protein [Methanobrevibacter arboriphilus]OQD58363.1 adhesin-like protein [Methanobrevibacter arboriphilus JCM 13429 = DSM 1125]